MSKIEQALKCAYSAFSPAVRGRSLQEGFARLRQSLNQLTSNDLRLQETLDIIASKRLKKPEFAPVTYVHLIETPVFSAGIFVIEKDSKIPLHDHPGMNGFLKVIHGRVSLKSMTTQVPTTSRTNLYKVTEKTSVELDENASCHIFSPGENNIHEITAIGGCASFLDILAPPYDYDGVYGEKRICNYYSLAETSSQNGIAEVRRVPCPSDFWCDEAPYLGPSVEHLFEEM